MSYPLPDEYQEAIQNPAGCFSFNDYSLMHGIVECNSIGLPRVRSGNFASVYKIRYDDSQYAVKCFLNFSENLHRRYAAISRYLAEAGNRYFVSFEFIPSGITVRGQKYPILKMDWVNGMSIDKYVSGCIAKNDTHGILALRGWFINMCRYLTGLRIAHGDLQHGNIIVTDSDLALIDYDGTYVPTMGIESCPEVGHPNYQHPKRSPSDFNEHADTFSAIVIYTALTVLAHHPDLWKKYYNGDNLLFSEKDFLNSNQSALFRELSRIQEPAIKILVNVLASACVKPFLQIPDFLTLCDEINNVTTSSIELASWADTWEEMPGVVDLWLNDDGQCLIAGARPHIVEGGNLNVENSIQAPLAPILTHEFLEFKTICGGCGSENNESAALCLHCGYPLTESLYATETAHTQHAVNTVPGAEVICPGCHGRNVESSALCEHCGFLLSEPVQTEPEQTIPLSAMLVKTPVNTHLGRLSQLKWCTIYFILFFFLMAVYDQTENGNLSSFLVASLKRAVIAWKERPSIENMKARHIGDSSAIKACSKKIENNPQDPSLYESRGKLYSKAGQYKQAIADFSTAIKLAPGLSSAYAARSVVYRMLGDERSALADEATAKKTFKP
ncbi:MAG: hypothetical protein HQK94_09235 [Nitrospirae bacterium]|nr:hypothetical protein [Nitrospirota bacterium]